MQVGTIEISVEVPVVVVVAVVVVSINPLEFPTFLNLNAVLFEADNF
ncbi:hypothetical protein HDC92_000614 [Pedobacter sp. AK017]|nr:hypothetical protein [Pedobacter sp. AK017]